MTDATRSRSKIAALLAILALSAGTMVWLFWHFPVITAVATLAILTALGVSARLAHLTDSEAKDLKRNEGSV
jgi:CHASE2 domain-containing sensor protein